MGKLESNSKVNVGTEFIIRIPMHQISTKNSQSTLELEDNNQI
ncbi:hypothetical protein [Dapis sp. BLCC M126]